MVRVALTTANASIACVGPRTDVAVQDAVVLGAPEECAEVLVLATCLGRLVNEGVSDAAWGH